MHDNARRVIYVTYSPAILLRHPSGPRHGRQTDAPTAPRRRAVARPVRPARPGAVRGAHGHRRIPVGPLAAHTPPAGDRRRPHGAPAGPAAAHARPGPALRPPPARGRRRGRRRRGRHLALPGADHRPGGHRRRGQYRRRGHRHPPGRAGGAAVDVGHRRLRHGLEVLRGLPRCALPHHRRPRPAVRRPPSTTSSGPSGARAGGRYPSSSPARPSWPPSASAR